MGRARGGNIIINSSVLETKLNDISIEPKTECFNFKGNFNLTNPSSGTVDVEVNDLGFNVVNSIPSYLQVDGSTVIDNGNGTFSILNVNNFTSLPISLFGAVADLEYQTVTTDGSTATLTGTAFADQSYVGKHINIKAGHQNPDTADGSEVANTTLGRIVAFKGIIQSVVDGVSITIDGIPNIAGSLRAYIYTNNTEALHKATRFCYYNKIQNLTIDLNGILGINPYVKGLYSSETTIGTDIYLEESGISITSNTARFKITNEFDSVNTRFFNLLSGNNDFHLNVPVLPADQFAQNPMDNNHAIVSVYGVGTSIRNIIIENQNYNKNDFDGDDAWWNFVFDGDSSGGRYSAANGRESQKVIINNCNARCKNGSYGNFQADGNSNEMWFYDTHILDIQHFEGERGRETYPDLLTDGMDWSFATGNFSVTSNTITTTETNFSWYDYRPDEISITITVNGQTATISSITNAKTAVLTAGISDISNQDCLIQVTGRNYFAHGMYIHPSMICVMVRTSSNDMPGNIKMYSAGGSVEDELGEWYIIDCTKGLYNLETFSGGTSSTATQTFISNSKVDFFGMSGFCTVKNSDVTGVFIGKSFLTEGGNTYNMTTNSIVIDDNLKFISIGERGNIPLTFTGSNTEIVVQSWFHEDNDVCPLPTNGTLRLIDTYTPNNRMMGGFGSVGNANMTIEFINSKTDYFDGGFSMLRNLGLTAANLNFKSSRFYSNRNDDLFFNTDRSNQNLGCIEVINEFNEYYVTKHRPDFNRWNFYKECEFVSFNPMESNFFKVFDMNFSMAVADFGFQSNTNKNLLYTGNVDVRSDFFLWNRLPLFRGTIKFRFEGSCSTNPYQHLNGAGAFNSSLRENTTLSNLCVKSVDRVDGEIVEFYIDNRFGRLIEINSSVPRKYTSALPTRLGVQNEKLYLDDNSGTYWEHIITFADDAGNSYSGTQSNVDEKDDANVTTNTNTHVVLDTPQEFSIFQEKSDGSDLATFVPTLNISGGGTLTFEYQDQFETNDPATIENHPNYTSWLWHFKGTNNAYEFIMNNRTGEITFNGTISETLDTANILTVTTGNKITNRQWVQNTN